jgi:hypothetical protein
MHAFVELLVKLVCVSDEIKGFQEPQNVQITLTLLQEMHEIK